MAQVLPGVDLGGATMRCKTALTMAHWLKDTVQPALKIAMPGRKITGLVPGSTYQCRLRNSASTGKISEHGRGNAFDVAAFKLDNGEKVVPAYLLQPEIVYKDNYEKLLVEGGYYTEDQLK